VACLVCGWAYFKKLYAAMGNIISIANQKGGVGKTTTAINLSASLAAAEKKCLLVDCDPQGNATTGLGVERAELKRGLYDLLTENSPCENVVTETAFPGLHLIGATADLVGVEVELYSMREKEYCLKKGLMKLKGMYDYIFLDCPPSLGFLSINALVAADSVLIPLQCEYYALEGISQMLQAINAVRRGLNPGLRLAGVLLTMYDKRNNLSMQVVEEVRHHFKGMVFKTVIPRNVRLGEAPSHGKPVILYDISCKGSQGYLALAREIITGVEAEDD